MMYANFCDTRFRETNVLGENGDRDWVSDFWQRWQEYRETLYRCCLKLMNFNSADAEDALSQAMLKAWEKVQKYAGKIANFKAWLMQLTRNFCIDLIRKRARSAAGVEDIEWVGTEGKMETASAVKTPEEGLENEEKYNVIREAIASLPERFRETFVLHFYQERSHQEIARAQGISYDNVCKRISLARKMLKEKLRSYFQEEETEILPQSTPKKKKPKKSKPKKTQESAIAPPTPENVPEEVEEKPQTVIEEESREQENKEISEPPREDEARSLLSRRSVELSDSTTEEKGSSDRLEETGKESVRSRKLTPKKKPKPEKTTAIAIAIPPPEGNREGKKRSFFSFFSKDVADKIVIELGAIARIQKVNFLSRSP